MSAEDAFRPTFSEMVGWASRLSSATDPDDDLLKETAMFERLSAAFEQVSETTWRQGQTVYDSRTDFETLNKLRPELRVLCLEALRLFDEEVKLPTTPWNQMIIP